MEKTRQEVSKAAWKLYKMRFIEQNSFRSLHKGFFLPGTPQERFMNLFAEQLKLDGWTFYSVDNLPLLDREELFDKENPPLPEHIIVQKSIYKEDYLQGIEKIENRLDKLVEGFDPMGQKFHIYPKLFDYQKEAVMHCLDCLRKNHGSMLAMEMGTGKTITTLAVIEIIRKIFKKPLRIIVFNHKNGLSVWKGEIKKWYRGGVFTELNSKNTFEVGAFMKEFRNDLDKFVLCSYDLVNSVEHPGKAHEFLANLGHKSIDIVILDESHRIKNVRTNRSQNIRSLIRYLSNYVMCLTGTPMTIGPVDLFAQFDALESNAMGADRREVVRRFRGAKMKLENISQSDSMENVTVKYMMKKYAYDALKDDVLDLPPQTDVSVLCPWESGDPRLKELYDVVSDALDIKKHVNMKNISKKKLQEIVNTGLGESQEQVFWNGREVVLGKVHIFNWMVKCSQILNGCIPVYRLDENGDKIIISENPETSEVEYAKEYLPCFGAPKYRKLLKMLPDLPRPIILVGRWKTEVEMFKEIARQVEEPFGEITGDLKDGITKDGDLREDISILGVNIASGSESYNMTRSHTVLYCGVGYRFGQYLQMRARVHRIGQENECHHLLLNTKNSVDDHVWDCMQNKKSIISAILDSSDFRASASFEEEYLQNLSIADAEKHSDDIDEEYDESIDDVEEKYRES